MSPSRPYLVRALHAWITDNALTPQLLVDATVDGVDVPAAYVQEGRIVLNISLSAVRGLELGNEHILFSARFGGAPRDVSVPVQAVLAIYARENGVGMAFQGEEPEGEPPPAPDSDGSARPSLRVVK